MRNIFILLTFYVVVEAFYLTDFSKCKQDKADIFFLLDASDSASQLFLKQKDFVKKILSSLAVESGKVHAGIATFSDLLHLEVDLNNDVSRLKTYLDHIYLKGGSTNLGFALKSIEIDGFSSSNARSTATKIVVVLTDGQSSDDPTEAVKILMARNIKIFAIGNKDGDKTRELRMIASRPTSYYTFTLDSPNIMEAIRDAVQCKSPNTDCSSMHNIKLQFFIDTPSYSRLTSSKLINFVTDASSMLAQANAEFAVGVNFGVIGHQDMTPSFHIDTAIKNITNYHFYQQAGMIDSFLRSIGNVRIDRRQKYLLILFIDKSAEPFTELKARIEDLKVKLRGTFSFFIITFGESIDRDFTRSMASHISYYFHIPDIRYMDVSYEDFVHLLCSSSL